MMTTAHKSFLVSLTFHALMGSLAFIILTQMRTPPPMIKIHTKHLMLVSLSNATPHQKQPEIVKTITKIAHPQPTISAKAIIPQPHTPPITTALNTIAIPTYVVSTPPIAIHNVQTTPVADIAQKPKVDIASEMQSFKSALRTKIKQNLHYPSTARRRGMEGEVSIRFILFHDGSIHEISVLQGENIFHTAAKNAVASASGVNVPKNIADSLPMEMELTLEFKLNS